MKKRTRALLTMLMALLLAMAAMPTWASAEAISVNVEATEQTDVLDLPASNAALAERYINTVFYPQSGAATQSAADNLKPLEKVVYDLMKEQLMAVAAGQQSSTVFDVTPAQVMEKMDGIKFTWSEDEIGVPFYTIVDSKIQIDKDVVYDFLDKQYGSLYDPTHVAHALLRDNPGAFYWIMSGATYSYSTPWSGFGASYSDGKVIIRCDTKDLTFHCAFKVDEEYAISINEVNVSKFGAVQAALNNAQQIIAAGAGMTDLERMTYYMQEIRRLSEYNTPAAADDYTGNSSPWQMIYVFDGDPETKVVCEGYSKAFKYLCDNTTFSDPSLEVISVSGQLGDDKFDFGPHMWSIVQTSKGNYLVDVTNCVTSGSTKNSAFFSVPDGIRTLNFTDGTSVDAYYFNMDNNGAKYVLYFYYNSETRKVFLDSDLELATTPFTPDDPTPPTPTITPEPEPEKPVKEVSLQLDQGDSPSYLWFNGKFSPLLEMEGIPKTYSITYNGSTCCIGLNEFGELTINDVGTCVITFETDVAITKLTVTVTDLHTLILPENTMEIGADAFLNTKPDRIVLPEGVTAVQPNAFNTLGQLQLLLNGDYTEAVLENLPTDALWLCNEKTANWAKDHGILYLIHQ